MKTYREIFTYGKQELEKAEIQDSAEEAWFLLAYVYEISRAWYFAHEMEAAEPEKAESYRELIQKRQQHIPAQYLTREAWFFGLHFYVDERVLIPRPDTEILVEAVLHKAGQRKNLEILDVCTGSGCILLSLLANLKSARGTGVDLSQDALEVAKKNGEDLGTAAAWIQSDLFEHVSGKYDILVSNPPYIQRQELKNLMPEVRDQEPRMALDGGEDGLDFYRRLLAQAGDYLKPGGIAAFEIGYDQGKAVAQLMQRQRYQEVQVLQDLAGLDRVVIGIVYQEEEDV